MRQEGTFKFSANYEPEIKGELDARKYVPNYSDLLAFTLNNKIPFGFVVACGGLDDTSKRGLWQFEGDDSTLNNPMFWKLLSGDIGEVLNGFPDDSDFPDYVEEE